MLPQGNEGLTPKQIAQRKYRLANAEKLRERAAIYRLCNAEQYAASNAASKDRYKRSERGAYMRRTNQQAKRYGLVREQVAAILALPCAICGDESKHVDHDHATGKVRAGLCAHCNKGLGMFRDKPDLLLNAANYIKEHMKSESSETQKLVQPEPASLLDFEDDTPLVCQRDQTGDKPCESCQ